MCQRLRELRVRAKMTQEKLANELGVEKSTIAKWEGGAAYPRLQSLVKLAQALNITEGEVIAAITPAKRKGG